ncbi:MAG TPA: hypothetical protein VGU24_04960 [Microvirga sp.]|jgi:hypothetical protein|nr:hypothetical protein [Microvirga sp.]
MSPDQTGRTNYTPPGYISLGQALIIQLAVECDNETWEREQFETEGEQCDPEMFGIDNDRPKYAKVRLVTSVAILKYFWGVDILVDDGSTRLIPPLESTRDITWLPFPARDALLLVRGALSSGRLVARVVDHEEGHLIPIPSHFWNKIDAERILWSDDLVSISADGREVSGHVIIQFSEFYEYLKGSGMHPLARDEIDDEDEVDETGSSHATPSKSSSARSDKITSSPELLPSGGTQTSSYKVDGIFTGRQPERDRARFALRELYPTGIPGPGELSNSDLNKQVNEYLVRKGGRAVSRWTVLRAAGRWD